MKECSICGMPLEKGADSDVCDYCNNDDGIEMLASDENDDLDM